MKTTNIILGIAVGLFLTSCDSFTDVSEPTSQITSSAVFMEYSSANAALSDIYSRLREEGVLSGTNTAGTVLMANYSDDLIFAGTNANTEQFAMHTVLPSNTHINSLWRNTYAHLYAINAFLEGVTASSGISDAQRERFMGEALFLRASLHFYLCNLFGAVPYVTSTDYIINSRISKSPQMAVYDAVIDDLKQAEELLPMDYSTSERVRPNRAAATAMLARVFLYAEQWEEARDHATAVIENPMYQWQENADLEFVKENPAIIWAIHSGLAGLNTRDARSYSFTSGVPNRSTISPSLINSFELGDLRRSLWIMTINSSGGPWYHAYKYKKTTTVGTTAEHTIVLRLSELYLIRAEAHVMMQEPDLAKSDVNKIRNRAGLANTDAELPQELLDGIMDERRWELFTEQGHRWFDLKRTGRAGELSQVKPNWAAHQVLFPIPENELLLNGNLLPQNTGY